MRKQFTRFTPHFWFHICLSASFAWYLFRNVLMQPTAAMIGANGDGFKNYFTFLYHTFYGKGIWFKGMNYPYGEHVTFTDNQPLLSVPLSYLNQVLHFQIPTLLGIMNLILILSFLLSSIFTFMLLNKLKVNPWISSIAAVVITFFSPNILRVFGHFGLSYTFYIPLLILLFYAYFEQNRKTILLGIILVLVSIAFLHFYNFAIGAFLIASLWFATLLFNVKNLKATFLKTYGVILSVFLAFVVVKLILLFTDPIQDRPTNPWGTLSYLSNWRSVLTSNSSDLGSFLNILFSDLESVEFGGEGYGYIGILNVFFCVWIILLIILKLTNRCLKMEIPVFEDAQKQMMLAGFLCLLFSMGVPFIWGFENSIDTVPMMKQFRSLGRFSVIFYFLTSISMVIGVHKIFSSLKSQFKYVEMSFVAILLLGVSTIEMFGYGKIIQKRSDTSSKDYEAFTNYIDSVQLSKDLNKEINNHQAIVGFPFFCIGSEKVGYGQSGFIIDASFQFSLATGLPIVNTHLSRSSWSQSFSLMRLTGGPLSDKSQFGSLLNKKNLLLIYQDSSALSPDEKYLFQHARYLTNIKGISCFSLSWENLMQYESRLKDSLKLAAPQANTLLVHRSFEEKNSEEKIFGKGAQATLNIPELNLLNEEIQLMKDSSYELSVWVKVNDVDYRMPHFYIELFDSALNRVENHDILFNRSLNDNQGFWVHIHEILKPSVDIKHIILDFINDDKSSATYIDELQIRPLYESVLLKESKKLLYNNHLVSW